MPIISVILLFLFFFVLAMKPTYICVRIESKEDETGLVFTQSPLIIAIAFKIACHDQIAILSWKEYNYALEMYNKIQEEKKLYEQKGKTLNDSVDSH